MRSMRELWRSIGSTSGAKIYSVLISLATLVVTARWLGPEGRGAVAAVITWTTVFSTVGYFSLGQVALHRAAEMRDRPWLAKMLGTLLLVAVLVAVLGWGVATGLYILTDGRIFGGLSPTVLLLGFAVLPLLVWEHYGSSLLMAVDRLEVYNRAQLIGRSVGILLVGLFVVVLDWGVYGALGAILLSQTVVALTGLSLLLSTAEGAVRPDRATIRELFDGGARLHINAIGAMMFGNADILIVQYYLGAEQTGHYQLAVQLMTVMMVVPQAASMVLYSAVARLGPDGAWDSTRHVLGRLSLSMLGLSAAAAVASPWLIPLVAGVEFRPSVGVFQILLLAMLGRTMSLVMAPQWIGRGLFLQTSFLTLGLGLLNLGTNFLVVPRYGMYGAAWATVATYVISVVGNGAFVIWIQRRIARARAAELNLVHAPVV